MLKEYRFHFFATAGASLLCLVFAAILMAWIKMGAAASVVTAIFLSFFAAVASRLSQMHTRFEIPGSQVVTGAARIQGAGAVIDLSRLNPRGAPRAIETLPPPHAPEPPTPLRAVLASRAAPSSTFPWNCRR